MIKSVFGIAVVVSIAVALAGCGGAKNSNTTISNVVSSWTGTLTSPRGNEALEIDFLVNGNTVTGRAYLAQVSQSGSFVGFSSDPSLAPSDVVSFPVTQSGNQATFTVFFSEAPSTNFTATRKDNSQSLGQMTVAPATFGPVQFTLSSGSNVLTGTYSTSGTNAESGTVNLTLDTQGTLANVAGAWSGTFTPSGATTFTPGSMALSMVQNGHLVNLNQSATNTVGTTQVQNTYGTMDGLIIAQTFYSRLNLVTDVNNHNPSGPFVANRYFMGTVSTSGITGTYRDTNSNGDSGTFNLVGVTGPMARRSAHR